MVHSQKMEKFWELSHAQYLTIPRSVIQEMSEEWQDKFAELLDKLDETIEWRPNQQYTYRCYKMHEEIHAKQIALLSDICPDALADYRHGNTYAKALIKKGD